MKARYMMKSKKGAYVEAKTRRELERLRENDGQFLYAHITSGVQAWHDVIRLNVIYPPYVKSRYEFISHNRELDA